MFRKQVNFRMEWLYGAFDKWDLVMLMTIISLVGAYMYSKYRTDYLKNNSISYNQSLNASTSSTSSAFQADKSFLGRMKSENRQVNFLFKFLSLI